MLLVLLLGGCGLFGEQARVSEVATEACRWGIDTQLPPPSMWPSEVDVASFIDPDDVLFARQQEALQAEDAGMFAALGDAVEGAMAGPAQRMATLLHDRTSCTVEELKINGDSGHVELAKSSPQVRDEAVFKLLGALASASEEEISKLLEESSSPKSSTVRYGLRRGADGALRIHLGAREAAIAEAQAEVSEAQAKLLAADEAKKQLATLLRVDSAALRRSRGWLASTVFDIKVTNTSEAPIASVSFDAEYRSPDRSVPWQRGPIAYRIPGGLEPGETAAWTLEPNIMSDFYRTEAVKGAVLDLKVSGLVGADDKPLVEVPDAQRAGIEKERGEKRLSKLVELPAAE